jgi:uncharacterized membrane protein YkgB
MQEVNNIIGLTKVEVLIVVVNINAQEVGKGAKVLQLEFCLQTLNQLINSKEVTASNNNIVNMY